MSTIKEIRNLAIKNDYFREILYEELISKMKDRALPILMFIVIKRNGDVKLRGCANRSFQCIYTDKHEVSLLTLTSIH